MESQKLLHKLTLSSRSLPRTHPSRHINDNHPLQVRVKKSPKYLGPPEITNCYSMRSSPRGQVLLINNEQFDEIMECHSHRMGSDVDGNNLEKLFLELGFQVNLQRNLSRNQMVSSIRAFAGSERHSSSDMAVVAILSHGSDGVLYGIDGVPVCTEWIVKQLDNKNCKWLRGKPKFFILQGCRGLIHDYGTPIHLFGTISDHKNIDASGCTLSDAEVFNGPRTTELRSPTVEDMLIACSTIPGYVSNRDTIRGSWFIECICKVFMTHAATTDIRDMLDQVSVEMSSYVSENGTKQACSYEVRHFYKKLFFNPGIRTAENIGSNITSKRYSRLGNIPRSMSDPYRLHIKISDLHQLPLCQSEGGDVPKTMPLSNLNAIIRNNLV